MRALLGDPLAPSALQPVPGLLETWKNEHIVSSQPPLHEVLLVYDTKIDPRTGHCHSSSSAATSQANRPWGQQGGLFNDFLVPERA